MPRVLKKRKTERIGVDHVKGDKEMIYSWVDFTTASKKIIKGHEEAIDHFAKNLSKDYRNYMPVQGYRHKRFQNPKGHSIPKVGSKLSYKGEFLTVLAKDKMKTSDEYSVVNVLYASHGKDPDSKTVKKFHWDVWDKQTGFVEDFNDA